MIKDRFLLAAKGAAMGVAEVIPGVSGGTIAFITGIYERLIDAIKAVGPEAISGYRQDGVQGVWKAVDGAFLINLLLGMGGGVILGVFAVGYLLDHYPEPLWGFFLGLILASCLYIGRMIKDWKPITIIALLAGAVVAYGVTTLAPAEGSDALPFVFLSGVIAISALILPGISGSFILLIMGMYHIVIPSIKGVLSNQDSKSISIFLVFAAGATVGITTFSRVVSYLFDKYEKVTLALLTGFMVGSLSKLWPWRHVSRIKMDDASVISIGGPDQLERIDPELYKVLVEQNVMPGDYWYPDSRLVITIAATVIGFAIVFMLEKLGDKAA